MNNNLPPIRTIPATEYFDVGQSIGRCRMSNTQAAFHCSRWLTIRASKDSSTFRLRLLGHLEQPSEKVYYWRVTSLGTCYDVSWPLSRDPHWCTEQAMGTRVTEVKDCGVHDFTR